MTSGPGPRIPRTEATQSLVEVMTAYLNHIDEIAVVRRTFTQAAAGGIAQG